MPVLLRGGLRLFENLEEEIGLEQLVFSEQHLGFVEHGSRSVCTSGSLGQPRHLTAFERIDGSHDPQLAGLHHRVQQRSRVANLRDHHFDVESDRVGDHITGHASRLLDRRANGPHKR